MASSGDLVEQWVKSVKVSEADLALAQESDHPFGTPAEHVGYLNNREAFAAPVRRAQPENMVVKSHGNDGLIYPQGYDHLNEAINMMIQDQMEINPLFRHARVELTYRQTLSEQVPARIVHTDPSRTPEPVEEDFVYFLANKQGVVVQSQHVKEPAQNLNKMTPEALMEEGLLRQSEDFEMVRGRQSTFHTQGAAIFQPARILLRLIVTHPSADYFHKLSDREKAALPEDFRQKHGISSPDMAPGLH